MQKKRVYVLALAIAFLTASAGFALWEVYDEGTWPESWPKSLKPLRARASTHIHRSQVVCVIPFSERSEFESAWPHILSLKSKQAPLVLQSSPSEWGPHPLSAGVRIRCPGTGDLINLQGTTKYPPGAESAIADGEFLKVGPPWPSDIETASGALPEYVFIENGKWHAWEGNPFELPNEFSKAMSLQRARTEIELIVDGKIVDLNRIGLPADTPIVDKRFQDSIKGATGSGK